MKNLMFCLILSILLAYSCSTHGPAYVDYPYGASVSYGEGRHPGIDFTLKRGTPIIAVSAGEVIYLDEPCPGERHCGGIFVMIRHDDHFKSLYGHLDKAFVEIGQLLKRGQLIGLSGASNSGNAHLHFGLCKIGGSCINYSQTYNPKKFWLNGTPQCFEPEMDYSSYSQKDITHPVACGDYANRLIAEAKN